MFHGIFRFSAELEVEIFASKYYDDDVIFKWEDENVFFSSSFEIKG
jgi:hypothetical protein